MSLPLFARAKREDGAAHKTMVWYMVWYAYSIEIGYLSSPSAGTETTSPPPRGCTLTVAICLLVVIGILSVVKEKARDFGVHIATHSDVVYVTS